MSRMQYVGFWGDTEGESAIGFPWPTIRPRSYPPDLALVERLKRVQKVVRVRQYKGWSDCRLCKQMNGSREYYTDSYTWPEGYAHYIQEHNIEVPPKFVDYIKKFPLETEYKASVQETLDKTRNYLDSIPTPLVDDTTVQHYTRKMQKKAKKMLTTVSQYLDFMESINRPRADPDELEACSDSIKQVVDTFCEMASTQINKQRNKRAKTE